MYPILENRHNTQPTARREHRQLLHNDLILMLGPHNQTRLEIVGIGRSITDIGYIFGSDHNCPTLCLLSLVSFYRNLLLAPRKVAEFGQNWIFDSSDIAFVFVQCSF